MDRLNEYNKTWKNLNAVYSAYAKKAGISVSKFMILYSLYTQPAATQKELCDTLGMPKQTVSAVLASLSKEGVIEISHNEGNKKSNFIALTNYGGKRVSALIEPVIKAETEALREIDDSAFASMIKSYDALKSNLESMLELNGE